MNYIKINYMKLWKKNDTRLNSLIEQYTVGDDYLLDSELLPYDIQASLAHAKGLQAIGVLTIEELGQIKTALAQLAEDFQAGKIKITIADEDCHTVIENYLTQEIGEAGKKFILAEAETIKCWWH